jgi:predicted RND superfamily exporter protein
MWGLSASILIIVVVCLMLFGSLRLALLALPPNIFPVAAVYGLMGLFKIPISSGSAMVATIALGIAVNDTMHFILYYRRKTREEGVAPRQAIIEAMDDLGRPVVLMSVVFCAGFTVFLLTDFQPLFHFGILSFVAMTSALAGDLVMLPNLLLLFDRFTPPVREPQREREASKAAPPVSVARPRPQPEPSRLSWLVQRRP